MNAKKPSMPARSDYVAPTLRSFTREELLELLGPAQGYGGPTGTMDVPPGSGKIIKRS